MESYLVFQVSTSSVLKWKLLEYLWKFYLGIWISSHHVFFVPFSGQKTMNFRLQNLEFHWWLDSRIGAHTSDEQEPLRREGATNSAVGFPSKNGGDFLMGFWWVEMCGVGKWRKTRSLWIFCLGEKGKDCNKKGVLETLLPAIGSNMIHLQYFIRLLYRFYFYYHFITHNYST